MTKERKAAIEQWQKAKIWIIEIPSKAFIKPDTAYAWEHNCWFCQYVRDNCDTPNALYNYQGCSHCPLNKWALAKGVIKSQDDFGCTHYAETLFHKVCDPKYLLEDRLEACDLIIRALKGEHIWED